MLRRRALVLAETWPDFLVLSKSVRRESKPVTFQYIQYEKDSLQFTPQIVSSIPISFITISFKVVDLVG